MKRSLLLGLALGAVLAAALVYSLTGSEEPAPPSPPPSMSSPVPSRTDTPGRRDEPAPPGSQLAVPVATDSGREPQHAAMPPPPSSDAPPSSGPVVLEAESPFAVDADSRELDYAFELVLGPDAGVESARAAAEVFERCLKQVPENRRCYDGLVAAQQRQSPDWKPPPPPSSLATEKSMAPQLPGQVVNKRRSPAPLVPTSRP